MADGITLPASSGTVATDDCGVAGHAQIVKMAASGNGDATPIPADATFGMFTHPAMRGHVLRTSSSGLTTATTLYSAGDQLGAQVSWTGAILASFTGIARIDHAILKVNTPNVVSAVDLLLFDQSVTPAADNAAASWSDADMDHLIGIIEFRAAKNYALNAVLLGLNTPILIEPASGTTLYGCMVTQVAHSAHFGNAADLVPVLGIAYN